MFARGAPATHSSLGPEIPSAGRLALVRQGFVTRDPSDIQCQPCPWPVWTAFKDRYTRCWVRSGALQLFGGYWPIVGYVTPMAAPGQDHFRRDASDQPNAGRWGEQHASPLTRQQLLHAKLFRHRVLFANNWSGETRPGCIANPLLSWARTKLVGNWRLLPQRQRRMRQR